MAALTDVLHRVARLAADLPLIAELDINPLILAVSPAAHDEQVRSLVGSPHRRPAPGRTWLPATSQAHARGRAKVLTDGLKVMGTATPGGTRVRNGTLRPRLERSATMADRVIEELERGECLRLIAAGGIGRIAYTSRFGLTVLPVNYSLARGADRVPHRGAQSAG